MTSQATTDRLAADRKQADGLDVKGTPTIYINGREFDAQQDLDDWVNLELSGEAPRGTTAPAAAATSAKAVSSVASSAVSPSPRK